MIHCVHADQKSRHRRVLTNLAQGVGGTVYSLSNYRVDIKPHVLAMMGIAYGMNSLYRSVLSSQQRFWYVDHAYLARGYSDHCEWMRVTVNGFVNNRIISTDSARYNKYFSTVKPGPWRGFKGQYILYSPVTDAVALIYPQARQWQHEQLETVSSMGLPIRVRVKSPEVRMDSEGRIISNQVVKQARTLEQDLAEAALVLTYSSSISVDATLKGIPVIVGLNNIAWPISRDLSCLDQEPDRQSWLYSVVNSQFNTEELRSGLFRQFI